MSKISSILSILGLILMFAITSCGKTEFDELDTVITSDNVKTFSLEDLSIKDDDVIDDNGNSHGEDDTDDGTVTDDEDDDEDEEEDRK